MASLLVGAKEYKLQAQTKKVTPAWYKYIILTNIRTVKLESPPPYVLYKVIDENKMNDPNNKIVLSGVSSGQYGTRVEILDTNLHVVNRSYYAHVKILTFTGFININKLRKPTTSQFAVADYKDTFLGELMSMEDKSNIDTSAFLNICDPLVRKTLPKNIKESSDAEALRLINSALGDEVYGTLNIKGKKYNNVIGCIPVVKSGSEPKADICLVSFDSKNGKIILYPSCFISFKKPNFRTYGGYTEGEEEGIAFHEEAKKQQQKVFRKIRDKNIVKKILYGKSADRENSGIDNCDHIISATNITISGTTLNVLSGEIFNRGEIPENELEPYFVFVKGQRERSFISPRRYTQQGKTQEI